MGSRYDIAVFIGPSLCTFEEAVAERHTLGGRVEGPWLTRSSVAVAEFDAGGRRGVVVASPPMKTPRGVDVRLAETIGATETLIATVWDSVGTYELTVVGDGVDRYLSIESDDDGNAERYTSGVKLPEEPAGNYLDESFVQQVFKRRAGFDPADVSRLGWEWRALDARG